MGAKPSGIRKSTLAMRFLLEERGVDLLEMQLAVYKKAIDAFDNGRGENEKSDAGPGYLSVANTAVATLAKYAYPTLSAIKIEDMNQSVNDKMIDAAKVRDIIINDPFAKNVADIIQKPQDTGLPVLTVGKKNE